MNRLPFRLWLVAFFSLVLAIANLAQAPSAVLSTKEDVQRDIELVPCKNADRVAAVESLFRKLGATDADISYVENKGVRNVVITKQGKSSDTIIVGAHYDKVDDGCGALDNWTGIVDIAHLYRTLHSIDTAKTFKFVAFDKEEIGLVGSEAFVKAIPKEQKTAYCSMVNLDSFGLTLPWVMENTSSPKMIRDVKEFWTSMKLKLESVPISGAEADSTSFLDSGIPAITFTGLNGRWAEFLHSRNDKLSNVKGESVYYGYRLVLPYLAHLDGAPCDAFRK